MRRFLLFLLISSLALTAFFIGSSGVQSQTQDHYSLDLQGFVWNRASLSVLVVTSENESWWSQNDLDCALRAIGEWNDAISAFSSNYTDYSYLSSLSLLPTVSNRTLPGFDIYVNWTESPPGTPDEVGLSQIIPDYRGVIINCTNSLASHYYHGNPLSDGDKQNIALHELGHSLGLGHSNYTGDVMYPYYAMGSSGKSISTLDVYGVATLFSGEQNTTNFYPIKGWLKENSVTLPPNITYKELPISPQNTLPESLANNSLVQTIVLMFEILIHPEIFAFVVLFICILVVVALIPKKRKPGKTVSETP